MGISCNSNTAHSSIVSNAPRLTANSVANVEESFRVPLLLQAQKRLVVASEELGLEVGLLEVGLVHVRATSGGKSFNLLHDDVGHEVLVGDHLLPGCGEVPDGGQGSVDEGVTPGGGDGVGLLGAELANVGSDADEGGALLGNAAGEGADVGDVVAGNEAAAVLSNADLDVTDGQRAEVLVVVVVVALVLGVGGGVVHLEGVKAGDEGGEQGLDLSSGLVVRVEGGDLEETGGEVVYDHGAAIDHTGKLLVESIDGVEEGSVVIVGGHHDKGGTTKLGISVSLDGHGGDNTPVTGATTGESPVEISILGLGSSQESTVGYNNLPLQDVIRAETERGGQSAVATTLCVTSSNANSRALAANNSKASVVGSLHNVEALGTGTDLHGLAGVGGGVPVNNLGAGQMMSPDGEGSGSGGATKVVMAGVTNDEANIILSGEGDGGRDVLRGLGVDGVDDVVTQSTGTRLRLEGIAALVGEEGGHDRGRGSHATSLLVT